MSRNETTRRIGYKNGSHSVSSDPLTAIIAQTLTHEAPRTTCPETDRCRAGYPRLVTQHVLCESDCTRARDTRMLIQKLSYTTD